MAEAGVGGGAISERLRYCRSRHLVLRFRTSNGLQNNVGMSQRNYTNSQYPPSGSHDLYTIIAGSQPTVKCRIAKAPEEE